MTWYAGGLRFECTGCGRCCRGPTPGRVWVTIREIKALAAFLKLDIETFARRYLLRSGRRLSLLESASRDCIFWREDVGCSVYEVRPDQCRLYPFWAEIVETEEAWEAESKKCPGMDRGTLYSATMIADLLEGRGAAEERARNDPEDPPPTSPPRALKQPRTTSEREAERFEV